MISVTADIVVFNENTDDASDLPTHVLLVRRDKEPFKDHWALPGGFVNEGEDLADAAVRELKEETGLALPFPSARQIGTFGRPGRDPRGHVITVAHLAWVQKRPKVVGADDAAEAQWVPIDDEGFIRQEWENHDPAAGPTHPTILAFDHQEIIERAWMVYVGG